MSLNRGSEESEVHRHGDADDKTIEEERQNFRRAVRLVRARARMAPYEIVVFDSGQEPDYRYLATPKEGGAAAPPAAAAAPAPAATPAKP